MQYSIRGVTPRLDALLRKRARQEGKSLNQAALHALERGLDMDAPPRRYDDLDDLAGSWVADPAVESALSQMDRIDEDLWR